MKKISVSLLILSLCLISGFVLTLMVWARWTAPIALNQNAAVTQSTVTISPLSDLKDDSLAELVEYDHDDLDAGSVENIKMTNSQADSANTTNITTIRLEGDRISISGQGASVEGASVTITSAGEYQISGTLNDGQILVDTKDEETVKTHLKRSEFVQQY